MSGNQQLGNSEALIIKIIHRNEAYMEAHVCEMNAEELSPFSHPSISSTADTREQFELFDMNFNSGWPGQWF